MQEVFDVCANGQQLKCLTIVDEFTQECSAIGVADDSAVMRRGQPK